MKVNIQRVLPEELYRNMKGATLTIEDKKYIPLKLKINEANFVGFTIYYRFICVLPDPNSDYEYLRLQVRVENIDFKQVVAKRSLQYRDIKKGSNKREFIFQFCPPFKGGYNIILDSFYKLRYFIQTTQPLEEKRETIKTIANCEEPFDVQENIVCEPESTSISFPLFLQFIVTSKLQDDTIKMESNFVSKNFRHSMLNDKKTFQLQGGQVYSVIYELSPVSIGVLNDKGLMLGTFQLQYNQQGKYQKKSSLKPNNKPIFFRGETLDKHIVKKDIAEVLIRFTNSFSIDYKLGDITIKIDDKKIPPGIKILKVSKDKINLDMRMEETITISLISLKSGFFVLTGISLEVKSKQNELQEELVKFVNDLTLFIENQRDEKAEKVLKPSIVFEIDLI